MVPYTVNANGKYTWEIPVTSLDKGLAVAAFSHRTQSWYDVNPDLWSATLNKIGEIKDDTQKTDAAPTPSVAPTGTPTPTGNTDSNSYTGCKS